MDHIGPHAVYPGGSGYGTKIRNVLLHDVERWSSVKKWLGIIALVLLVWFVVTQPDPAANSVESIAGTLENWAENVASFFTQVVT